MSNGKRITKSDVERQFSWLQRARYPEGYSERAIVKSLKRKFEQSCKDEKIHNGKKRTPAKVIRQGHKTVKHLRCTVSHLKHQDGNVRRDARRLLRSITHPQVSFKEISRHASRLAGLVQKAGRRRADERREAAARSINVGHRYLLEEITSKRKLRSTGRSLGNCLGDPPPLHMYWSQIKEGDIEIWRVLQRTKDDDWKLRGLVETWTWGRTIGQCQGPKGKPLKLKRKVAKHILRALNASGDDAKSFVRVGAFTAFLGDRPKVEPLEVGDRLVSMWRYPDQIILMAQDRRGGKRTWGRLYRDDGIWHESVHDEEFSGLVDLLLTHPSAAENCFPSPGAEAEELSSPEGKV